MDFYVTETSALHSRERTLVYTIPTYLFNLPDDLIRVVVRADSLVKKVKTSSEFTDIVHV